MMNSREHFFTITKVFNYLRKDIGIFGFLITKMHTLKVAKIIIHADPHTYLEDLYLYPYKLNQFGFGIVPTEGSSSGTDTEDWNNELLPVPISVDLPF